ncbi:hypothetical protein MRB53_001431 [Persea americana]|uniref:Uncharacterized protein n=1 Tax=Persea americana TaxID=3435 RepID=A0ACC2MSD3_PERAE|nr:hypothetical protein MRB53_001431 [Persea americana]
MLSHQAAVRRNICLASGAILHSAIDGIWKARNLLIHREGEDSPGRQSCGNEPALAAAEAEGLLRIKGHSSRGKTVAQVALRWVYEQGVIMVVKSFNKERMKENQEIFDWELTQEESQKISNITQRKGLPAVGFVSDDGPYKSLDELWDGEI